MANQRGKHIDNTDLSIDQAEARGFIHRDYIAHCLRWTHVAKYLQKHYGRARVLDIGCGKHLPLAKLMYSSRLISHDYVGLEYNASHKFDMEPFHSGKFPISAYGGVDFASNQVEIISPESSLAQTQDMVIRYKGDVETAEHILPNVLVSFEMLEHIEPGHARATLKKMRMIMQHCRAITGDDPIAFISTPCYDAMTGAAANHVNEMTFTALGALIESLGFKIQNVYGTFASQKDYLGQLRKDGHGAAFDALSQYYDSNYLATIFAPLYPQYARNALWELRVPTERELSDSIPSRFPPLSEVPGIWTSSEHWSDLARDDAYVAN